MDISVVMSTFNRSAVLGQALDGLMAQEAGGLSYEIIIVDNNSTDNTREIIESYAQRDSRIRYVLERKQGVAYGRNAGIAVAQGEFIAFCDDDVIVKSDWLRRMHAALLRFPEADFVGGKVLPIWKAPPPPWLNAKLSPLALQDYGDTPEIVSSDNPRCLISACLAARRRAFERAGYFDPATQRVGNGIGSTEDHEWELKVWDKGGIGVYVPDVACYAEIPAYRMVKSYHRRWHLGHGKFSAIARRSEFDGGAFRLFDVPAFLYRQTLGAASGYLGAVVKGNSAETFARENRLFFFLGFIRERWMRTLTRRNKTKSAIPSPTASMQSPDPS